MSIAICFVAISLIGYGINEYVQKGDFQVLVIFTSIVTVLSLFYPVLSTWCLYFLTILLSLVWCSIAGLAIDKVCSRVEAGKKVQRSKS